MYVDFLILFPFGPFFVSLTSHSSVNDELLKKKTQIFHAKSIFHLIFEEFIQFVHLYFEIMLIGFSIESLAVRTASSSISNNEIEIISFSREDLKIAIAHTFFSFRRCFPPHSTRERSQLHLFEFILLYFVFHILTPAFSVAS